MVAGPDGNHMSTSPWRWPPSRGVDVDENAFRTLMNEQKERARADARAKKTGHSDIRVFRELEKEMGGGSAFLGYTESSSEATVAGVLLDGVPQSVVTAPAEVAQ